ncbi:MAG: hypothetical protein BWK80_22235 [Desulfobacteraceae bacterium IS3]|nr:MAG: hypothetical protein BWK80_22235 [Desulfobacteraceae bacterium IS3]
MFAYIDPILIFPYRIFENPMAGFLSGTSILCLWCVIIGDISARIIFRINRSYYQRLKQETADMHDLSIKALICKDKESYRACNKEANDAFGRYFFSQVAAGASVLWPVALGMGWMQTRFQDVGFPMIFPFSMIFGESAKYPLIFILFYILCRILFNSVPIRKHS